VLPAAAGDNDQRDQQIAPGNRTESLVVHASGPGASATGQNAGIISTGDRAINFQIGAGLAVSGVTLLFAATGLVIGSILNISHWNSLGGLYPVAISVIVLIPSAGHLIMQRRRRARDAQLPDDARRRKAAKYLTDVVLTSMSRYAADQSITPNGPISVRWRHAHDEPGTEFVQTRRSIAPKARDAGNEQGVLAGVSWLLRNLRAATGADRSALPNGGQRLEEPAQRNPGIRPAAPARQLADLEFCQQDSLSEEVVTSWYDTIYSRLGNGVLVVLGDGGSGKTGSLLLLLIKALKERSGAANQETIPVPVWISCSSWDPRISLRSHVSAVLARDYPMLTARRFGGPDCPRELIDHGQIALFLDGLDEVPMDRRSSALDRIVEHATATSAPAVVTCRSEEWSMAAGGRHSPRAVIELCPVRLDDAAEFLCQGRTAIQRAAWEPVLEYARENPGAPVNKVLSSPLGLTIASKVYSSPAGVQGGGPRQLIKLATETEAYDQLFRHYIRIVCSGQSRRDRIMSGGSHTSAFHLDSRRYEQALAFLAEHLQQAGTTDFEWWTLRDSAPRWLSGAFVGCLVALAIGLDLFGVGVGIGAGLLAGFGVTLVSRGRRKDAYSYGIVSGVVGGAVGGMVAWLTASVGFGPLGALPKPGGIGVYLPGPLAIGIGLGVLGGVRGGFAGSLVGGFVSSYVGDPLSGHAWLLPPGALDALCNGIAFGIVGGTAVQMSGRRIPARALKWSMSGIPVGLVAAAAVLTTGSLYQGWTTGIPLAAATGIAASVSNGFVADPGAELAASPRSVLARDRNTFLVVSISAGFCLWAATAAVHARDTGAFNWLVGAAWLGFFQASWGAFNVARVWLATEGRIPWRLLAFLEDAKDRGILRQIGSVYKFRHLQLQEYLCNRIIREPPGILEAGKPGRDQDDLWRAAGD
jgi:hypothetical protein